MNKRQRKKRAKKIAERILQIIIETLNEPFKQDLNNTTLEIDEEKGSIISHYKYPGKIYCTEFKLSFTVGDKEDKK